MEPAVADFRETYRAQISRSYHGVLHGLAVLTFGIAGLVWALWFWGLPGWFQIPVIAANLVFANFAIYFIHKELGHRLRGFAKLFYQRHAKEHHRFFSPSAIAWQSPRDLRVVFFPLPLLFVVMAASAGVGFGVESLGVADAHASAVFFTTVGYYLAYETTHFCDHLPEGHPITSIPGLHYMRAHHRGHHDPRHMHRMNFNIVFPLADWVLGTLVPRSELLASSPDRSSADDEAPSS